MSVDSGAASAAILAMTTGVGYFNVMLPPISEVRKATLADRSFSCDVRIGEMAASGLTMGIGLVASSLTGSPVPAVIALITSVGLVCMYENTLRRVPYELV